MTVRHVDLQIEIFSSKSHRLSPVGRANGSAVATRRDTRLRSKRLANLESDGESQSRYRDRIGAGVPRGCHALWSRGTAPSSTAELLAHTRFATPRLDAGRTLDRGVARSACESMFQLRLRSRNNSHETRRQDGVFRVSRGVSGQASSGRWTSSADDNAKNNHAHPRTRGAYCSAGKSRKG